MAAKLGFAGSKISRWRTGFSEPTFSDLDALAKLEGVEIADLWTEGGKARPRWRPAADEVDFLRSEIARSFERITKAVDKLEG